MQNGGAGHGASGRATRVQDLVRPAWPPLRHVERGWQELTAAERAEVEARVAAVLREHQWGPHARDALLHLFSFLAQVETIAIEIPLRFLPRAPKQLRPLLRRQLVDEVFHSALFARLAHELALPSAQPPAPLASAERLLDRIRHEEDLGITATLLNLVAEGWIETLFRHALRWRVADAVFRAVLADEARHVDEASRYMQGLDPAKAAAAVRAFEQGMVEVGSEPTVALAIHDLAGAAGQRNLTAALHAQHERHLRAAGLEPSPEWRELAALAQADLPGGTAQPAPAMPTEVQDTAWRRMARRVWQTPRDPTMQGDFDVPVGHVPRKLLTPVIIAALGRAWAANEGLNRIVARDRVWQLPHANVGVRVLLDDDELATVVIPEAERRSVRDIQRMLADGIQQLRRDGARRAEGGAAGAPGAARPSFVADPEVAALVPALPYMFAVALSNAGKWGVVSGAGSFSGWVSPSTDITVGLRRRLPAWKGLGYVPAWHVNVAAIQDHRVFDGRASALTVRAIQQALSRQGVKAILAAKDSLPPEAEWDGDLALHAAPGPSAAAVPAGFFGLLGLPKATPFVIGGLALGAVAGVGGYLLYQNLGTGAAGAASALGQAAKAPGQAPSAPSAAAQPAAPRPVASAGPPAPEARPAKPEPAGGAQGKPGKGRKPRPGKAGRNASKRAPKRKGGAR